MLNFSQLISNKILDTIIVPATIDNFNSLFLEQKKWGAIKISPSAIKEIKYIAAYQTAPISAITHLAEIKSIEKAEEKGKYIIYFNNDPTKITDIKFDGTMGSQIQGARYTNKENLLKAKTISDLFKNY